MKFESKESIVQHINTLDGYEGYVQFSHRAIDMSKDVFKNKVVHIEDESGFIYEAHFFKDDKSIGIKQINNIWLVSETDTSKVEGEDMQIYHAKEDLKVNMAQIWTIENDPLCDSNIHTKGMKVRKLQKVVFAGFVGDKK